LLQIEKTFNNFVTPMSYKGRLRANTGWMCWCLRRRTAEDSPVPLYGTTGLHAEAAVARALGSAA
jgi:hypothetical protein